MRVRVCVQSSEQLIPNRRGRLCEGILAVRKAGRIVPVGIHEHAQQQPRSQPIVKSALFSFGTKLLQFFARGVKQGVKPWEGSDVFPEICDGLIIVQLTLIRLHFLDKRRF